MDKPLTEKSHQGHNGIFPVPDPTDLTTEALLREISQLKELLRAEASGNFAVMREQFESIATQFAMLEKQRVEQKLDTKAAVDAALIAQKEAVKEQTLASDRAISKNEAATTKQLDQQAIGFATAVKGATDQLNDMKDRINEVKGDISRIADNKQGGVDRANNVNTIIIAILSIITIGSVILGVIQHTK